MMQCQWLPHRADLPSAQCEDVTHIISSTHEVDGLKPEQLGTKHNTACPKVMTVFCAINSITCASQCRVHRIT